MIDLFEDGYTQCTPSKNKLLVLSRQYDWVPTAWVNGKHPVPKSITNKALLPFTHNAFVWQAAKGF